MITKITDLIEAIVSCSMGNAVYVSIMDVRRWKVYVFLRRTMRLVPPKLKQNFETLTSN